MSARRSSRAAFGDPNRVPRKKSGKIYLNMGTDVSLGSEKALPNKKIDNTTKNPTQTERNSEIPNNGQSSNEYIMGPCESIGDSCDQSSCMTNLRNESNTEHVIGPACKHPVVLEKTNDSEMFKCALLAGVW
jgi:hypothetical protein